MSKHLLLRNSYFYYRQWIPLDLRSFFDGRADITTSLKTKDKREALTLLRGLQQKYQLTFTLLRSGILSKSTKTKSSVRVVPIHFKLIELGLVDYVSAKINKEHNLWGFSQWKGTWVSLSLRINGLLQLIEHSTLGHY